MENQKRSTKTTVVGVILLVLLVSLGIYTVYQNNKLNASNTFLEEEKSTIEDDLDAMIAKYDAAIAENTELDEELRLEREDIALLRDSVKNLKETNYSIIRRYRNKISSLEASNQELFRQNDSLRISNQLLADDLVIANDSISVQTVLLDTLNVRNAELAEIIGVGAKLKVSTVSTVSMKERNNGKLVATARANRTDALRISFTVAENELAEKGERLAFVQVQAPNGEIVRQVGSAVLEDQTTIDYSDETTLDFDNVTLEVLTLIEVNRKEMSKGTYSVKVFLEKRLVALSGFILK